MAYSSDAAMVSSGIDGVPSGLSTTCPGSYGTCMNPAMVPGNRRSHRYSAWYMMLLHTNVPAV